MNSNYCVICGEEIPDGSLICNACVEKYKKGANDDDYVNHPKHYETGKFECIKVMQEIYGKNDVRAFCLCNAFKYLYRAKNKENQKQDIEKAIWYLKKWGEFDD